MRSSFRGPLLMVAASAAFTVMVALIKVGRGAGFDTTEMLLWRAAPAAVVLWVGLGLRVPTPQRPGLLLVRCVLGFCAMFSFFSATQGLGVGELSVMSRLQPMWVALIASLVLGSEERPGRGVLLAMALGLAGTAVLVWPTIGTTQVRMTSVAWGLAAAVFSASAHVTLRALGKSESPSTIVFWFQIAVALAAGASLGSGVSATHDVELGHLPALLGLSASAMLGQLWMTRAYRIERAARVAAASYVSPVLGFAVDAVFFDAMPTPYAVVGAVLVVAAGGVLLGWRQTD